MALYRGAKQGKQFCLCMRQWLEDIFVVIFLAGMEHIVVVACLMRLVRQTDSASGAGKLPNRHKTGGGLLPDANDLVELM